MARIRFWATSILILMLWAALFLPALLNTAPIGKNIYYLLLSAVLLSAPLICGYSTIFFGVALIVIGAVNILHGLYSGGLVNEYAIISVLRANGANILIL